jgi:hypothetical protein
VQHHGLSHFDARHPLPVVHGTWGELDGVPSVGSLRLETIDRDHVTFESFPPARLHDFIRDVTVCRDQAMAIIAQVESSRQEPRR